MNLKKKHERSVGTVPDPVKGGRISVYKINCIQNNLYSYGQNW